MQHSSALGHNTDTSVNTFWVWDIKDVKSQETETFTLDVPRQMNEQSTVGANMTNPCIVTPKQRLEGKLVRTDHISPRMTTLKELQSFYELPSSQELLYGYVQEIQTPDTFKGSLQFTPNK